MTAGHNFTALVLAAATAFSSGLNAATILVPNAASFYSTRTLPVAGDPFYNPVSQYHAQDSLGQYAYGYSGGPSSKTETKTLDGITRGSYSYIDANNILQTVQYTADPWNGFRAAATNLPNGPQSIAETAEVAAARAEHMAAHQSANAAAAQANFEDALKPRIVTTPAAATLTASAPIAYAPSTGAFSYSYTNAAPSPAYLYPAYPALRPAALQYAFSAVPAVQPQPFVFQRFGEASYFGAGSPSNPEKPAELPVADRKLNDAETRPFEVTDTVAVRAERLSENVRKAFDKP